jgi:hypothetical protein
MKASQKLASDVVLRHVDSERVRQRRNAANQHLLNALTEMDRRYGAEATVLVLVRYVGVLLMDGYGRPLIRFCAAYLARCILKHACRRVLTYKPRLH